MPVIAIARQAKLIEGKAPREPWLRADRGVRRFHDLVRLAGIESLLPTNQSTSHVGSGACTLRQPGVYLKVVAMVLPREHHRVEQTNVVSSLSDEELAAMVEHLQQRIAMTREGYGPSINRRRGRLWV
jgi:hypothetical protein